LVLFLFADWIFERARSATRLFGMAPEMRARSIRKVQCSSV
jgi:hypothetical protein